MRVNETKITTRYSETDQMGVIYHANYFIYFELGRTDFLTQLGMTYKDMEAMGIIMPVINVSCKYIKSAKYYDQLIVSTIVKEITAVRMKFGYEILRDGELLAQGETEHAFVSKDEHKPVNLKKINSKLFAQLSALI